MANELEGKKVLYKDKFGDFTLTGTVDEVIVDDGFNYYHVKPDVEVPGDMNIPVAYLREDIVPLREAGGEIPQNVGSYIAGLNLEALPPKVSQAIKDDLLSDADIANSSMEEEEFKRFKRMIEEKYPQALLPKEEAKPEPELPSEKIEEAEEIHEEPEPEKEPEFNRAEIEAAIAGLQILAEDGDQDSIDAIAGLKILLEDAPQEVAEMAYAKGGKAPHIEHREIGKDETIAGVEHEVLPATGFDYHGKEEIENAHPLGTIYKEGKFGYVQSGYNWLKFPISKLPEIEKNRLEKGGEIKNQYEGATPEQVWDRWNEIQRLHFFHDHDGIGIKGIKQEEREKIIAGKFKALPPEIKNAVQSHIKMGQYEKGGKAGEGKHLVAEFLYRDGANYKTYGKIRIPKDKEGIFEVGEDREVTEFGITNEEWYDKYLPGEYDEAYDHNLLEILEIRPEKASDHIDDKHPIVYEKGGLTKGRDRIGKMPEKEGDIVRIKNPLADEDGKMEYMVQDDPSLYEDDQQILCMALNTGMSIAPIDSIEKKDLVVVVPAEDVIDAKHKLKFSGGVENLHGGDDNNDDEMARGGKVKWTEKDYENHLNEVGEMFDYESDEWIIDGKNRYDQFKGKWGAAKRKYDPIAFQTGYNDWKNEPDGEYKKGGKIRSGVAVLVYDKGKLYESSPDMEEQAEIISDEYWKYLNGKATYAQLKMTVEANDLIKVPEGSINECTIHNEFRQKKIPILFRINIVPLKKGEIFKGPAAIIYVKDGYANAIDVENIGNVNKVVDALFKYKEGTLDWEALGKVIFDNAATYRNNFTLVGMDEISYKIHSTYFKKDVPVLWTIYLDKSSSGGGGKKMEAGGKTDGKGSGWGPFSPGERVTSLEGLKAGDIILEDSKTWSAKNVIMITDLQKTHAANQHGRNIVYAQFVNPDNIKEKRGTTKESDFAIWQHELEAGEYFFPKSDEPIKLGSKVILSAEKLEKHFKAKGSKAAKAYKTLLLKHVNEVGEVVVYDVSGSQKSEWGVVVVKYGKRSIKVPKSVLVGLPEYSVGGVLLAGVGLLGAGAVNYVGGVGAKHAHKKILKYQKKRNEARIGMMEEGGIVHKTLKEMYAGTDGKIPNNYEGKTPEQVWGEWTEKQKKEFLTDHRNDFVGLEIAKGSLNVWEDYSIKEGITSSFENLPQGIKDELAVHIYEGQYESGGAIPIPNGYEGKTPEEIWNSWTPQQRQHFGDDHFRNYKKVDEIKNLTYNELSLVYQQSVDHHVEEGQYERGGGIPTPDGYEGKSEGEIWNGWTEKQKEHFLVDHGFSINEGYSEKWFENIFKSAYDELPIEIANKLAYHVKAGQYARGGGVFKDREEVETEASLINKWKYHDKGTGFLEWLPDTPQYIKDLDQTHYERFLQYEKNNHLARGGKAESNVSRLIDKWTKTAKENLLGKVVRHASFMTKEEAKNLGWGDSNKYEQCLVIEFTDDSYILPSMDDEGNDAGFFAFRYMEEGEYKRDVKLLPGMKIFDAGYEDGKKSGWGAIAPSISFEHPDFTLTVIAMRDPEGNDAGAIFGFDKNDKDISLPVIPMRFENGGEIDEEYKRGGKTKNWIRDAISGHPGILRRKAERQGLVKGDLSLSALHTLEKQGGKTAKEAYLAETLRGFHEEGGAVPSAEKKVFDVHFYYKDKPRAKRNEYFRTGSYEDYTEAEDENTFFYVNDEEELKSLMSEDNGEDFVITGYEEVKEKGGRLGAISEAIKFNNDTERLYVEALIEMRLAGRTGGVMIGANEMFFAKKLEDCEYLYVDKTPGSYTANLTEKGEKMIWANVEKVNKEPFDFDADWDKIKESILGERYFMVIFKKDGKEYGYMPFKYGPKYNKEMTEDKEHFFKSAALKFRKGGKVTFDDKVDAIADNLLGKKVPGKYRKEYGKRYGKNTSVEAAKHIAGSQLTPAERLKGIRERSKKFKGKKLRKKEKGGVADEPSLKQIYDATKTPDVSGKKEGKAKRHYDMSKRNQKSQLKKQTA